MSSENSESDGRREEAIETGKAPADGPARDCVRLETYSHKQTLIANLPYFLMIGLGFAILTAGMGATAGAWACGALYWLYGIAGAVWVMIFICPYCVYHGTRSCPCGYGWIAALFRESKGEDRFGERFKRHIPVIVPLWLIPPIAGGAMLWREFSAGLLMLVVLFALDAFVALPLVSRRGCCAKCPQKESCPWMGTSKKKG